MVYWKHSKVHEQCSTLPTKSLAYYFIRSYNHTMHTPSQRSQYFSSFSKTNLYAGHTNWPVLKLKLG